MTHALLTVDDGQVLRAWLRAHHATLFQGLQQQPLQDRLQQLSVERAEEDPTFWRLLNQVQDVFPSHGSL